MRIICVEDRSAAFIDACLRSAKRHGHRIEIVRPAPQPPRGFADFVQHYRHHSTNSKEFELACFRRYFEAAAIVGSTERVILADTDVIFNDDPSALTDLVGEPHDGIVASIGYGAAGPEADVCPHLSLWNHALLEAFCEFLVRTYERSGSRLEAMYQARVNSPGAASAISDMTLLRLFVDDERIPLRNTNKVAGGRIVDHNFGGRFSENVSFAMTNGFKTFHRADGVLYFQGAESDDLVRPVVLHLQGRAKVAGPDLVDGRDVRARARLAVIGAARWARQAMFGANSPVLAPK